MRKIFLNTILVFLIFSGFAYGALPIVYFSDLTDGVVTGWNQSATKGAAVSIWGRNFGSSRGSSYVTVGGVSLSHSPDYAEWGAKNNPKTANELERITFWLNTDMALGDTTIKVTTPDGTSNAISFYTRNSGHIYFVSPSGNDNNTGLNDTNQMWATFHKVQLSVNSGDVVYFRNGLWTEVDSGSGSADTIMRLYNGYGDGYQNGTLHHSITLASYPNEVAKIGRGLQNEAVNFVYRYTAPNEVGLAYWTFSKFDINTYSTNFCWDASIDNNNDNSLRIVGNAMTTVVPSGNEPMLSIFTNATDMRIYGNYMHGAGKVHDSDPHNGSKAKAIYFCGGGISNNVDIGWNEISRCDGHSQFFGHFRSDRLDNLKFHDNFVHDQGQQVIVFGGGDPQADPQYHFLGQGIKIYNNIFANNMGHVRFANSANGLGGFFEVYNNTFYNNTQSFGHSEILLTQYEDSFNFHNNIVDEGPDSSNPQYWYNRPAGYDSAPHSNNETGNHNLWHGHGAGPAWSTNDWDDIAPQFIVDHPVNYSDFRLKETSPIYNKNVGVQIGSFGAPRVSTIGTTMTLILKDP